MAPGKVHDLHSLEVVLDGLGISLKAFFIDAVGQQKGYRDCIKYVQGVQLEANPTTSIDGFLRYVVGALDQPCFDIVRRASCVDRVDWQLSIA